MRVNSRVFTEKTDLMGEILIPNCPSQFRSVAERMILMLTKPGFSFPDYRNVSQLDKMLMAYFWAEYDGLNQGDTDFSAWFMEKATMPDLITRARRWLVEHNYLFLKPDVQEYALQASAKWKQSVRR